MRTNLLNEMEKVERRELNTVLQTELHFRAFQILAVSKVVEKLIKEDERKEKEQK